jgi:phospholipid/cholesterol/gamma-HCH transport system substrate-binding protein
MKKFNIELAVGLFVILGILSLAYLSVRLGKLEVLGGKTYTVYAMFERAGGIRPGSVVEIAGVEVGRVKAVSLSEDYLATVALALDKEVKIQDDSIASVKTKGLIGEKYVQISPGGSEEIIPEEGLIRDTESSADIEELLSSYVFGKI